MMYMVACCSSSTDRHPVSGSNEVFFASFFRRRSRNLFIQAIALTSLSQEEWYVIKQLKGASSAKATAEISFALTSGSLIDNGRRIDGLDGQ